MKFNVYLTKEMDGKRIGLIASADTFNNAYKAYQKWTESDEFKRKYKRTLYTISTIVKANEKEILDFGSYSDFVLIVKE